MQGQVTGTSPGNTVKVWFVDADNPAVASDSFTYTAKVESSNRVLVLAAEDYTGISPPYKKTNAPAYLSYYTDALAANGIGADVYDVDANGRKAPSRSACSATTRPSIWYTGDDVITREPGMVPATASRLANDEMLAVRAFLNEGGRLLYTGKYAGYQSAFGIRVQHRDERAVRSGFRRGRLPAAVGRLPAVLPRRVHLQRRRRNDVEREDLRRLRDRRAVRRRPSAGRSGRRARGTRITAPRSSRRARSCLRTGSRTCRRAGSRRSSTGRAGRSTRTPGRTTCTRRSPTSRTSA